MDFTTLFGQIGGMIQSIVNAMAKPKFYAEIFDIIDHLAVVAKDGFYVLSESK